MKKISLLSLFFVILIVSCGLKPEEQVKEFAIKFGDFVNTSQKDSIQKYYPDFELTDSLTNIGISDIVINQINDEGTYTIEYSPKTSIIVKMEQNGNIIVNDSKGLFAFSQSQKEMLKKTDKWDDALSDIEISNLIAEENEKRNSLTSPDLDFFNLHGPVKEMTVSISSSKDEYGYETAPYGGFWLQKGKYSFNEEGEWINYKTFRVLNIKRNSEGYIVEMFFPPLYDDGSKYDKSSYVWESNVLSKVTDPWDWGNFSYSDGVLLNFNYTICPGEGHGYWNINFTDYQYDDMGNWISCSWTGKYHGDFGDTGKAKGTVKRELNYF